ncbi:response regulator transcription factor [Galbibacter orientalis]|uniref:Response regulator containing a CheY-like receiver domain and an HTH DNA-binding domain n=1 Tax=Galbibacter orientalis DSM 19592 TaxID=926559 RepID=I3C5X3_9FLAO|nr:response regulator transcription factor [Galbibacter orientalis]EIJ39016.1 response regulator containing a CheY-like receiver domain and an HTH DNA-binding domain [Galbibacter orientalis DSM 19592]
MIKVLVADNHPIVRIGLETALNNNGITEVIGSVSTTTELFNALSTKNPDVILLEMDIPEVNGITALRRLKKDQSDIKVLIYSTQAEDVYALSTLRAGASGYVSKTASLDTLIDAIKRVANGGMFITNELAQRLAFDESTNKPRKLFRKLSTREIEVLKLLASGRRNKQVAEELGLNEKTVSTYKARLMKKLNVDNMVDMLQQAKALELY